MVEKADFQNFDGILRREKTVLADFYSDTCLPCRRMMPVFSELDTELGWHFKAVKVNVNCNSELARRYGVRAVPTFILFKNGEEAERIVGAVEKNRLADLITGSKRGS